MNNYWFLYKLTDGSIKLAQLVSDTEWTNIPDGCQVIGFTSDKITDVVKDAFEKPSKYKVVNNELSINSDYVEPTIIVVPTDSDRISALESTMSVLMGV